MKKVSILLVFLLFLQSCSVYNKSATIDTAVISDKKVKVITTDNQKYSFHRLQSENNRLLGITKLKSSTAKKLAAFPAVSEGKYLRIDLSELDIEKIKFRNEVTSTFVTIYTITGALTLLYIIFNYSSFAAVDPGIF